MSLVSFGETAPVRRSSSPCEIVPRRWSLDAFRLSSGPSRSRGCDRSRLRSDGERVTVMLAFPINVASIIIASINIALITAVSLKTLEIVFRRGGTQAAFLRHDCGQRQVDIGSQPCRIAADIEMSPFLKPGEHVA